MPRWSVRASERYRTLLALRQYEHARSAYPFGEAIHYSDRRDGRAAEGVASEVRDYLATKGFADVVVVPLAPSVEDTFIERTTEVAA